MVLGYLPKRMGIQDPVGGFVGFRVEALELEAQGLRLKVLLRNDAVAMMAEL